MGAAAEQLNVRVDPALKRAFAAKAAKRGEAMGDVVSRALVKYVRDARMPGPFELPAGFAWTPVPDGRSARSGAGGGFKTSVRIPAALAGRVAASPLSLAQLIGLGLDAQDALAAAARPAPDPEPAASRPARLSAVRAGKVTAAARAVSMTRPQDTLRALQAITGIPARH